MHATHLVCLRCGHRVPFDPAAYLCPRCGAGARGDDPGILDVHYDYEAAGRALTLALETSRRDVFRFLPVLPVERPAPVLPAGGTPLVPAPRLARRLGLRALYLKDETRNPTRCLKDRATAVGVSLALARGFRDVYCASAGNAAISLAGYAAHQGVRCHVFVPAGASAERRAWLERYGADVRVSEGDYDRAYAEAEREGARHGWYSRNCAFNPYLVEGKKTAAYEIAEQLDWDVPALVAAPVGDGCTLGAIGKGFGELRMMGFTERLPRLVGVQAEGVQPVVRRFRSGEAGAEIGTTRAASIAVRRPRNVCRVLGEIETSGGTMLAVTDEAMTEAQRLLAAEAGVVAELTGAAGLAALVRLADVGELGDGAAVVVVTGGRPD